MSATSSRSDCELVDRLGLDRVGVDDGLADVAERVVHRVRERVDGGRLAVAGDDEAGAAVRREILRDGGDPLRARRRRGAAPGTPATPTAAAIARATASISLARSARR